MISGIDERAARAELERRKEQWLYEDRYDPRPQPSFTEDEARILRRAHFAVRPTEEDGWGRVLPEYYCAECLQPWKDGGCPTVRLLHRWHFQGERIEQLDHRNRNMAEFLAEWFARRFVGTSPRGNDRAVAECTLVVDGRVLEAGRMMVVDELLAKMRRQWKDYLTQLFPPDPTVEAAKAFNEGLANIERSKRRAERQADGE